MAIIQDWRIRSTNARCEVSGEPFADGEDFYTCIFEDQESDGFVRRDYSLDSWREMRRKMKPAPFSFWKSTYKAPARTSSEEREADTSIEGMLRRFIDEDDPRTENARYILALMLERKKTLIPSDTKETDNRTLLFYEHADNGDVFIVADPGLRLDEIESIQREVVDLLAEEDRRAASQSEEVTEAPENQSESNEDQSEESGDKSSESEEETVGMPGEEFPDGVGLDSPVDPGNEFANAVDNEFQDSEGGEEPPPGDHESQG